MVTKVVIDDYEDIMKEYNPKKNITRNVLTRYEKTKIIGMRLEQLARGAPPNVSVPKDVNDLRSIVLQELEQRKLPFLIGRSLPNGGKEYWRIEDMVI